MLSWFCTPREIRTLTTLYVTQVAYPVCIPGQKNQIISKGRFVIHRVTSEMFKFSGGYRYRTDHSLIANQTRQASGT